MNSFKRDDSYSASARLGYENSLHIKEKARYLTEKKRYEEEKRRSWIQFWIPLIVSNAISLSALIVAILAYTKQ